MLPSPRQHEFSVFDEAEGQAPRGRLVMLKRVGLAALTALVAISIWTVCPVFALWVGANVVGQQMLSMTAVIVVIVVLAVEVFSMAVALTWLNNTYDELVGRPRAERRSAWLRSMRANGEGHVSQRVGITLPERIVTINVYVLTIAVTIWWIFFAPPVGLTGSS